VLARTRRTLTALRFGTASVAGPAGCPVRADFGHAAGFRVQCRARAAAQVAMFSATLPTHVEALARQVLKRPLEITAGGLARRVCKRGSV